jgi:hypothetical protein
MGETAVFPTIDGGNANLLLEQDVTLAQAGTLQSLSFYVSAVSGSLRLGLYDNAGNIIVQTAAFTPVFGWNTRAVSPTPLAAGAYLLAYTPSSDGLNFPVERSVGRCAWAARTFGAMPTTFPPLNGSDVCRWSFYATMSEP